MEPSAEGSNSRIIDRAPLDQWPRRTRVRQEPDQVRPTDSRRQLWNARRCSGAADDLRLAGRSKPSLVGLISKSDGVLMKGGALLLLALLLLLSDPAVILKR